MENKEAKKVISSGVEVTVKGPLEIAGKPIKIGAKVTVRADQAARLREQGIVE